jgi:hypothetical protein
MVYLPAEFNSETISFIVSDTLAGTYGLPNADADTAGYTFSAPAAPAWHIVPESLVQAAAFIKVQTGTAAAGAATITGVLKSF